MLSIDRVSPRLPAPPRPRRLRGWLLAIALMAGLLLTHVFGDHDNSSVAAGPMTAGMSLAGPIAAGRAHDLTPPGGTDQPAAVTPAPGATGSDVPAEPGPTEPPWAAGCILALLVIGGTVLLMAAAGRYRSTAATDPPGPPWTPRPGPSAGVRPARLGLCVLRV